MQRGSDRGPALFCVLTKPPADIGVLTRDQISLRAVAEFARGLSGRAAKGASEVGGILKAQLIRNLSHGKRCVGKESFGLEQ